MPWTWLGMTTQASNVTFGRTTSVRSHWSSTILPQAFRRTAPSVTSPNTLMRSCVTTVTKYAPASRAPAPGGAPSALASLRHSIPPGPPRYV